MAWQEQCLERKFQDWLAGQATQHRIDESASYLVKLARLYLYLRPFGVPIPRSPSEELLRCAFRYLEEGGHEGAAVYWRG